MAKVLIVDDDLALSNLCRLVLKIHGHEAIVAHNGHQALEQLRTDCPDAIILDLEMPVMNGRSFFKKIRGQPHRPPVLILSAYGARAAQEELGTEAAMMKPFDPVELVQTVNSLV